MTILRCAVLDDFQQVATTVADWSGLADRVEIVSFAHHCADANELVNLLAETDIVVTLRERVVFDAAVLDRLPRLSLLVASGMRNSAIDLGAAARNQVTVSGTASSSTPPVELTWALILGITRHLVQENTALRSGGPWQSTVGTDLAGRRLGLLGLGRIGSAVARIGLAFGMDVHAWSPNLSEEHAAEVGVSRAPSLASLLESSDVVSVHLKLGERSRGLLVPAELAQMKTSAFLVNTSRAAIVDQAALMDALRASRLAGAAADVFDQEPLPEHHPLRDAPRFLATPHLGYVTHDNLSTYYREAVEDIEAWIAGSPIRVLT